MTFYFISFKLILFIISTPNSAHIIKLGSNVCGFLINLFFIINLIVIVNYNIFKFFKKIDTFKQYVNFINILYHFDIDMLIIIYYNYNIN